MLYHFYLVRTGCSVWNSLTWQNRQFSPSLPYTHTPFRWYMHGTPGPPSGPLLLPSTYSISWSRMYIKWYIYTNHHHHHSSYYCMYTFPIRISFTTTISNSFYKILATEGGDTERKLLKIDVQSCTPKLVFFYLFEMSIYLAFILQYDEASSTTAHPFWTVSVVLSLTLFFFCTLEVNIMNRVQICSCFQCKPTESSSALPQGVTLIEGIYFSPCSSALAEKLSPHSGSTHRKITLSLSEKDSLDGTKK